MALIVQKYGGTSVADPDRMRAVAENVQITKRHGNDVVVVVSAMGKATDNLIALASQVSGTRPGREMDMLLTTGERVSAALLTMALADLGVAAVSFTGSQVGIITDTVHGKAKIIEVKGDRVRQALADGKVAVVAGFQGVSTDREITTMGRGASDLTASALAKALDADACEIYTDVTGVFSADPRIVPRARKLARISFDEMLEMAGAGSKVLALRSVEFARNHGVALHVRSAFTWEPGTWVSDEPAHAGERPLEGSMEDPIISGVVTDATESKVTVLGVPDRPGISATLFEPLAAANVNVDMIVQNTSTDGTTDISFTVPSADMVIAEDIVERVAKEIGAAGVSHDGGIAKVSLVGAGMKTTPGIAARMFRTLADEDVNIEMISTSTIRISVVLAAVDLERAARALHTAFGLDSAAATTPRRSLSVADGPSPTVGRSCAEGEP